MTAGFNPRKAETHLISCFKTNECIKLVEAGLLLVVQNEKLEPHWLFVDKVGHSSYKSLKHLTLLTHTAQLAQLLMHSNAFLGGVAAHLFTIV